MDDSVGLVDHTKDIFVLECRFLTQFFLSMDVIYSTFVFEESNRTKI